MAYSKILIDFKGVPIDGLSLNFKETLTGINFHELFVEVRSSINQTSLPAFIQADDLHPDRYIGFVSTNYKNAVNVDSNATALFTITSINGTPNSGLGHVLITANYDNAEFVLELNELNATVTITNERKPSVKIDTISFLEADTTPCNKVKISIDTDILASKITSPFILNPNTENPIIFDWDRGQDIIFTVEDSTGFETTQVISLPKLLNASNFTINKNNTPFGTSISITNVNSQGLVLEYSLDNINYQSVNTYTNLTSGNYTLYVKDQLGCSFSKPFTIDEFGVNNPIFYVSKSNPIRYAQRVDFGDAINYKNDENTLSCETDAEVPTMEVQRFQSSDIVPTQFLSNYTSNVAKVIKEDATEDIIPIIKRSTFIGNKDKRDALKCLFSVGKTGIYFTQGNLYDYTTNSVTGTYALNGYLPYWAKVGGYIILDGVWHLIENIVFNEILNAEVIVINGSYVGVQVPVIVGSIFNFEDFEVYEFFVDMVNYIDQNIRVKITASKSGFPDVEYLSELINVQVLQISTYEILYWNDTNTDVYYSTGIKSKLRQQVEKIDLIDKQEQEVNYTDTTIDLLSANIYDGNEFEFSPISKEMVVKLKRALTHENLYINGVGYKKADSIESEVLGNTNFYTVKAKLFKDGNVYNSLISGSSEIYNGANLEVPGFVDYGGGFMKY